MSKKNFGIVGYGIVGKATHLSLLQKEKIFIHDINRNTKLDDVFFCDVTFICIPTNNEADVRSLMNIISLIHQNNQNNQIVIRSTIPIGTSAKIRDTIGCSIIYMPEFLRENHWQEDCKKRPILVGGSDITILQWLTHEDVLICSLEEAEIVKMMSNAYNSLRIIFANHFFDISNFYHSDYDHILALHTAVSSASTYLKMPGPDHLRGFGGKCLPKDLILLIESMKSMSIEQNLFSAIIKDNQKWRQQ